MKTHVRNIYIVDDIQENIQVLGKTLIKYGFNIQVATNGKQALAGIQNKKPDLILLDISMPEMDGYEVCEQLKMQEGTKHIPVIFLTAWSETEDVVRGFKVGGVDYITKPFRAEELISRINTHIELKEARDRLKEINSTKDRFFRIIGHDLKTPLSQVIQLLEMLKDDIDSLSKEELKTCLSYLRDSSVEGMNLLENLLEWASAQTGSISFTPESFSIADLIKDNIGLLDQQAKMKNIKIKASDLFVDIITADRNMINTVIRNLLSNAIKFTHSDGIIQFKTILENDKVVVSVEDNGVGMSEDACDNLFNISTCHSTNGTNDEKGTGIGLVLCKEFIERHNGLIWVESEIDKGSVFKFSIPVRNIED